MSEGLSCVLRQTDALALIEAARGVEAVGEDDERSMKCGYNLLRRRSVDAIETLSVYPPAHRLDAVETDLRWAGALKRRLVELAMPSALAVVERHLGRALTAQPAEEIRSLLRLAIDAAGAAVESLPTGRRPRLRDACELAVRRSLADRGRQRSGGRAAGRHAPGTVPIGDPFEALCPWQSWLELPPDLAARVGELDSNLRRVVTLRYGLAGRRPVTLVELAALSETTASTVSRLVAKAETELRRRRRSDEATKRRSDEGNDGHVVAS